MRWPRYVLLLLGPALFLILCTVAYFDLYHSATCLTSSTSTIPRPAPAAAAAQPESAPAPLVLQPYELVGGGPCYNSPCSYNGTCIWNTQSGGWRCDRCAKGYATTGYNCFPDKCLLHGNPCLNGGTCNPHCNRAPECSDDRSIGILCSCERGWRGPYCEHRDPCWVDEGGLNLTPYCFSGGSCWINSEVDSGRPDPMLMNWVRCGCPEGTAPPRCRPASVENECYSSPCANGGTCVDGFMSYTCQCPPGFVGLNCQTENPCLSAPCGEDGSNGRCQHVCYPRPPLDGQAWTEDNLRPDAGSCRQARWLCKDCPPGFVAPFSRHGHCYADPCASQPCENGATCHSECLNPPNCTVTDYSCHCPAGFIGKHCRNIDPCVLEERAMEKQRVEWLERERLLADPTNPMPATPTLQFHCPPTFYRCSSRCLDEECDVAEFDTCKLDWGRYDPIEYPDTEPPVPPEPLPLPAPPLRLALL